MNTFFRNIQNLLCALMLCSAMATVGCVSQDKYNDLRHQQDTMRSRLERSLSLAKQQQTYIDEHFNRYHIGENFAVPNFHPELQMLSDTEVRNLRIEINRLKREILAKDAKIATLEGKPISYISSENNQISPIAPNESNPQLVSPSVTSPVENKNTTTSAPKVPSLNTAVSQLLSNVKQTIAPYTSTYKLKETKQGAILPLACESVFGDAGEIRPETKTLLRVIASQLLQGKKCHLRVDGYAPKQGSKDEWQLSTDRANDIVHELQKHGAPSNLLSVSGYGDKVPVNGTQACIVLSFTP